MYEKIISLNNLKRNGYNVHEYIIPNSFDELKAVVNEWGFVTIRTDHTVNHEDLPFYIVKSGKSDLNSIWETALSEYYKLIVANGIKYDEIQMFNAVCKIDMDCNFHIEACKKKVPLRKMYNYPTINLFGNLCDNIQDWSHFGNDRIDFRLLRDVVNTVYEKEVFDKYVELTVYPTDVGIRKEPIVYWQIR